MKGLFARPGLWSPPPASMPVLIAVVVEVVTLQYLVMWFFWITVTGETSNHLVVNAYLMGLLVVAFMTWAVFRLRGSVTAATAGGFAVAAYALFARIQGETAFYFVDVPRREEVFGSTGLLVVRLARYGGFAAYVFGLAMVLAACISELSLARRLANTTGRSPSGGADSQPDRGWVVPAP